MKHPILFLLVLVTTLAGLSQCSILSKAQKHALKLARPFLDSSVTNLLTSRDQTSPPPRNLRRNSPRNLELMVDPTSIIVAADREEVNHILTVTLLQISLLFWYLFIPFYKAWTTLKLVWNIIFGLLKANLISNMIRHGITLFANF